MVEFIINVFLIILPVFALFFWIVLATYVVVYIIRRIKRHKDPSPDEDM